MLYYYILSAAGLEGEEEDQWAREGDPGGDVCRRPAWL